MLVHHVFGGEKERSNFLDLKKNNVIFSYSLVMIGMSTGAQTDLCFISEIFKTYGTHLETKQNDSIKSRGSSG